jgi:hypothetical protein
MRRLILSLLLVLALAAHGETLKVEVVAPRTATTTTTTAPRTLAADSIAARGREVGNTERFTVRFSLDSPELVKIVPDKTEQPDFELTAFDAKGKEVPVRYWITGTSIEYARVTVQMLVEIPVDAAERDRQIAALVDTAIAEATGDMKKLLETQRASAVAYFEHLFVQNRVGDFRLRIRVNDPRVARVEGEAGVTVVDKGRFTDRLREESGAGKPR